MLQPVMETTQTELFVDYNEKFVMLIKNHEYVCPDFCKRLLTSTYLVNVLIADVLFVRFGLVGGTKIGLL